MSTGAWFVLFPKARVPSKEAIISTLSTIRTSKVTDVGEMAFTVTTDGGSFDVGLNAESYVVVETREKVDRHRDVLDNPDEIATYDARFELLFDLRDMASGEIFNPLLAAAERLRACIAAEWPERAVTVSIGVATWHPEIAASATSAATHLLWEVGRAMHQAKGLGNVVRHARDLGRDLGPDAREGQ